jgi:hypothetical protein
VQPKTGPIRADLLGNMWAQEWGNIYDIVAPPSSGDIGFDINRPAQGEGKYDPIGMVKTGEGFFSSLGFAPLPETFWQRSQFVKPRDRDVVCHASAWDVDNVDDLRIKMCIKVNGDDFVTIHHELGHNYYQRAYNKQPTLPISMAPTTASTKRSAMPSRCRSRPNIWCRSACSIAKVPAPTRTPACCCARRWTRWRSCPSACWSTLALAGLSRQTARPTYNKAGPICA